MSEQDLIKKRLLSLDPERERLFRVNAGTGWQGKRLYALQGLNVPKGMVILANARPLHAAPSGWPDLVGWETVEITPDMVGKKIAVFVFEEVKFTGDLRPNQKPFRDVLEKMGGIHRVVRDQ